VQSVLLYAAGTWTLLSVDARALEAFHMKCQRQLLQIKWHQFVRSDAIAATTGLPSISETISRRRNALLGHVARLPDDVPAHKNCQVNLPLGRPSSSQWHRHPGCPRNRWVDQMRNDNNLPHALEVRCQSWSSRSDATALRPLSDDNNNNTAFT